MTAYNIRWLLSGFGEKRAAVHHIAASRLDIIAVSVVRHMLRAASREHRAPSLVGSIHDDGIREEWVGAAGEATAIELSETRKRARDGFGSEIRRRVSDRLGPSRRLRCRESQSPLVV
jgi:hypothetical protein